MKRIRLPKRIAVGSNKTGPVLWGFPEFMINAVFTQDALYNSKEFCEVIASLHPRLTSLMGEEQEGKCLDVTNDEQSTLVKMAVPSTNNTLLPEVQMVVAMSRLALHAAEPIEDKKPEEKNPEEPPKTR